ncbi:MAG: transglycosylase family protein, partial [Candidatus Saccharimonadales bacterium]
MKGFIKSRTAFISSLIFVFVLLLITQFPLQVSALTADQKLSIQSGVLYFNRNDELNNGCSASGGEGAGTPVNIPAGDALDEFMEAIALHESGGNPTANSGDGAYGKYQFIPRTWQNDAK